MNNDTMKQFKELLEGCYHRMQNISSSMVLEVEDKNEFAVDGEGQRETSSALVMQPRELMGKVTQMISLAKRDPNIAEENEKTIPQIVAMLSASLHMVRTEARVLYNEYASCKRTVPSKQISKVILRRIDEISMEMLEIRSDPMQFREMVEAIMQENGSDVPLNLFLKHFEYLLRRIKLNLHQRIMPLQQNITCVVKSIKMLSIQMQRLCKACILDSYKADMLLRELQRALDYCVYNGDVV